MFPALQNPPCSAPDSCAILPDGFCVIWPDGHIYGCASVEQNKFCSTLGFSLYLQLELRYGVMVALQILVLSAQVRILVPQPQTTRSPAHPDFFFFDAYPPQPGQISTAAPYPSGASLRRAVGSRQAKKACREPCRAAPARLCLIPRQDFCELQAAADGCCGLRLCRQKDSGRACRGGAATPARSAKHLLRMALTRTAENSEYEDCMAAKLQAARAGCREAGSPKIPSPAEQHLCPASAMHLPLNSRQRPSSKRIA